MEFRNLSTFVRVAELRSFSAAARELDYSQSAVSMQIAQLEEELGTRLFDRVGRSIALTEQGARFYGYAQNILRMTENACREMNNTSGVSGQLRIALAESLCMIGFPEVLGRYHQLYPQVQVIVSTATTTDMFRALAQNDVDLVYQLDTRVYRSDAVIALEEPVRVVFVAPREHPLASRKTVTLAECAACPFILTEKGMSYRSQLDECLARNGLEIQPFLEIGNPEIIARMVAKGMGLSLLPEFIVAEHVRRGEIVQLEVEGFSAGLWRQLIYHKGKWISPAMQAMIDLLCAPRGK
ncbi:MAG: LysR family transcriptional regulator [Eubacteriales bacterium]|nr:LysR family transcriptional regulator [bacterium]MDY2791231.1 LysR family transcriptional regulator [Eubacteriales bacterium]